MKSRLLTKLLNNTGYNVANHGDYIGVGSPMCHKLFSVDKKTLEIKYALDTFHKGRESVIDRDNTELLFIWDKLHELVTNGQMKDILEGVDVIENPLTVYTVTDGKLVETFTDAYGHPNKTIDGTQMYDNTYFKTMEEAIEYGIEESESYIKSFNERVVEIKEKLKEAEGIIETHNNHIIHLKSLKK